MLVNMGVLTVGKETTDFLQVVARYFPKSIWILLESLCGFDETLKIDLSRVPMIANNDMGGTSAKNIEHWA